MEIQIANEIQELLFAHGQVALPSMGTFVSEYQAANLDHSEGQISPPQYRLQFDAGLPIDDGLLLEHICKKYSISLNEARAQVEDFLLNARIALKAGERVNIPEIGRFYTDFTHKIQFLPENTPFNPDTYGMPSVRLQPISRMMQPPTAPINNTNTNIVHDVMPVATAQNTTPTPIAAINDKINSFSDLLTPSLFVLIILVIITMYMYFSDMKKTTPNSYKPMPIENIESPQPKINAPPPNSKQNTFGSQTPQRQPINRETLPPFSTEEYYEFAIKSPQPKTPNNNMVRQPNSTTPDISDYNPNARVMRECSVVVGIFDTPKAAKRAIDVVENFGYQIFTDYQQDKNIVGCRFSYESPQELQRRLNTLRTKFGERVAIVKK
jgi:nucleoid DNA-binding protein